MKTGVRHAQWWFRGELIDVTCILLLCWLTVCTVCSLWCVGTCRLTYIDCHTPLLHALDAVSRLYMCVSYNVDIHVLWFSKCVNVCVLCVVCWIKQSRGIQPLYTYKNTSQSLCNIYFYDRSIFTFPTSHYYNRVPGWADGFLCSIITTHNTQHNQLATVMNQLHHHNPLWPWHIDWVLLQVKDWVYCSRMWVRSLASLVRSHS